MTPRQLNWWAEEAQRQRAMRLIEDAQSASVPHMEASARSDYMARLRTLALTQEQREEEQKQREAAIAARWRAVRAANKAKRKLR